MPSPPEHSPPPGYTFQHDIGSRTNVSIEDLIDVFPSQSLHPHPYTPSPPLEVHTTQSQIQGHDVHFIEPTVGRSAITRRMSRYASLPYDSPPPNGTIPPQLHLTYPDSPTSPTSPSSPTISSPGSGPRPSPRAQTRPSSEYYTSAPPPPSSPPGSSIYYKLPYSPQPYPASEPQTRCPPNPTNYVSLSRKTTLPKRFPSLVRASASIRGEFTVDPGLHVPSAVLAPLNGGGGRGGEEGRRKNLRLEVENGGIDVDIYLVGESTSADGRALRTTVDLRIRGEESNRFPLIAKFHTPNLTRPPFHLTTTSITGYTSLHLPPSFHGPLTLTIPNGDIDKHISLSPAFRAHATILSETHIMRVYFVGELGGWRKGEQGWEGDLVDVSVGGGTDGGGGGRVRVQWVGEKDWDWVRKVGFWVGI